MGYIPFNYSSASQCLTPGGYVHVTLCKGQSGTDDSRAWGNTWQITAGASPAKLVLREEKQFDGYHKYAATGYR